MTTHYEKNLQHDIDRIRRKVTEMSARVEGALRNSLQALKDRNRQLAYSVILRDQQVDELEKEIDRLCLEFLLRQLPVAGTLRFVYAALRINLELERVGDYAESVSRHVLTVCSSPGEIPDDRFAEMAALAVPMLHDAVKAFVDQDVALARKTVEVEDKVDALRYEISHELVKRQQEGRLPLESLLALLTIVNRFERAADQAKSICQEVLYMCTGEYSRHQGTEVYRVLFIDEHNACRSQMAEAIGNSLGLAKFIFSSAGLDPKPLDPRTAAFLDGKGIDSTRSTSRSVGQVPHLEAYQILVALAEDARRVFPPPPTKVVCFDWSMADPSRVEGSEAQIKAAYEAAYSSLRAQIQDLAKAVLGDENHQSPS